MTVRDRLGGRSISAVVAWAGLLALTAAAVVMSGGATVLRDQRPATALRFVQADAPALARQAELTLVEAPDKPDAVARARADAREALGRDATLPAAWRTLAVTLPEGSADTPRLLKVAQWLSRRDALTQIALIEERVGRNDIAGALRHYDVVLRISTAYDPLLFPVLVAAASDPEIRPAFARQLVAAPMWRRRFLSYMADTGTPYMLRADIFAAMARVGALPDRDIVAAWATSSSLEGKFDAGERFYRLLAPAGASRTVRDGGFDRGNGIAPFDWMLDTDGALNVAIGTFEGDARLEMVSERGDGARGARQLVRLRPGQHRFRAVTGDIDGYEGGLPYAALTCATTGATIARIEGVSGARRLSGELAVPIDCFPQWLDLGLRQSPASTRNGTWIDTVTID